MPIVRIATMQVTIVEKAARSHAGAKCDLKISEGSAAEKARIAVKGRTTRPTRKRRDWRPSLQAFCILSGAIIAIRGRIVPRGIAEEPKRRTSRTARARETTAVASCPRDTAFILFVAHPAIGEYLQKALHEEGDEKQVQQHRVGMDASARPEADEPYPPDQRTAVRQRAMAASMLTAMRKACAAHPCWAVPPLPRIQGAAGAQQALAFPEPRWRPCAWWRRALPRALLTPGSRMTRGPARLEPSAIIEIPNCPVGAARDRAVRQSESRRRGYKRAPRWPRNHPQRKSYGERVVPRRHGGQRHRACAQD